MSEMMRPADRWHLQEIGRTVVDGTEYVVYSDGACTWAVKAADFDRETPEEDYSIWCQAEGAGIGDTELCRRIAEAADLDGIYSAGACCWVDRPLATIRP